MKDWPATQKTFYAMPYNKDNELDAKYLEEIYGSVEIGRACRQIVTVDVEDLVRLRQNEKVVVAFDVLRPIGKARSAIVGLLEAEPLDHRAHCSVRDENAFVHRLFEKRDPLTACAHAIAA